jgi:hypothetical protein
MSNLSITDEDVKIMFAKAISVGYSIRVSKLNGLDEWKKLEQIALEKNVSRIFNITESWKQIIEKCYCDNLVNDSLCFATIGDEIIVNDEIVINDVKMKKIDHYVVQLMRIPYKGKFNLTFVKLVQLGYNVGQAIAVLEFGGDGGKRYSDNIRSFLQNAKPNDLSTFITGDF